MMAAADHKARGNAAFQLGHFAEAIDCYSLALDRDGDPAWNAAILCNRAFARLQLDSPDEAALAEGDCSSVLLLDPVNIKALFRRAQARMVLGNLKDAKADLESIVAMEPGNPQANASLDIVRVQLAAQTKNGVFNPEFQAQLLNNTAQVSVLPPAVPLRLKSPRQDKANATKSHRYNEDFAEALRQCSIVAHNEAQSHATRDQEVAKAAWDDLQALELTVTKSARGLSKQVKKHAKRVPTQAKPLVTSTAQPAPIKAHTDALWAQLLEDERKTRSVYKSKASHVSRVFSTVDAYRLTDQFARRHIGAGEEDTAVMLQKIGVNSIEELIGKTVPSEIRLTKPLDLPEALSESQAFAALKKIASQNKTYKSFIGAGFNDTLTPFVIKRNVLENPGWYTAYTPYQAEVSQGRLEMLLNFQTMVSDLTGFPVAGASLLDEATAAAEAMALCNGAFNGKRAKFFVSRDVHPQNLAVLETRAEGFGIELVVGNPLTDLDFSTKEYSGALLQYPNTFGSVEDYTKLTDAAKANQSLVVVATDLLALTHLKNPAEFGADIAVGSAQRFGVPLMFGGPHAGFIATSEKYHRKLPGRIIGVSKDSRGERALRMAMQTREQHIRRDKATSNICTAQALLANMAASYAIYHGPDGLRKIAARSNLFAATLAAGVRSHTKATLVHDHFFDTVEIDLAGSGLSGTDVQRRANAHEINVRVISDSRVSVSFGESAELSDVGKLLYALGATEVVSAAALDALKPAAAKVQSSSIPASLQRTSPFLEHRVFNSKHSETELMRYLKSLEDKDLALNTSMISLGSCTMKLNAVAELEPVSWPEFTNVHPFAPEDQTLGYLEMIDTLHKALAEITGFAAVSSQPNSGAQGEYAGLLAIRAFHKANGDHHRNVCLIPVSAHGTNPASAVMAGMKVVVVKSDDSGNIDRVDLEEKANKHAHELGAFMITYPSTFGVFEEGVKDMCDLIHKHGGQVYMDGANMNAQVGLCNPGGIGADVCHLNLHKTFCIPHGGGGPGVGSIGVAAHLAPFLPGNPVVLTGGEGNHVVKKANLAVSAGPFGSAGILPISWMYIHMLGEQGLVKATSHAILHANYMAKTLEDHYDIVFRGKNGTCAHEFIIDIRPFKAHGIVEEDVAKRLQDFGFHSPTMSWPVVGTLMIEPTESENLAEMNRFCQSMILIRQEIEDVVQGKIAVEDSPLKHAPHTVDVVTANSWDRKYSRTQAAFPAPWHNEGKTKAFWPTVGRVDNVFGDRNLVCSCPPLDSYIEE
ncbi:hypothetical protein B5M09_003157 [Aphanomyces astaci]|uniref:glycine dehydrogenase (aminomethyl-transferring) n=1 Tax=Aphanomyces astaci TaxID=112090 RepID=A0A3R7YC69_APHAT|nr:hypothetical protein B5M09_003157 [Aphanomyces astaci]